MNKSEFLYRLFINILPISAVMGITAILPSLPDIEAHFNISSSKATLVITFYTIPGIFTALLSGLLTELLEHKKVLFLGLIFFTIPGLLCIFSSSFYELLLWRFIQGLGGGILAVISSILVADRFSGDKMTKIMGEVSASRNVLMAIFPTIGGFLGEIAWFGAFFISGIGILLIIFYFKISFENKKSVFNFKDYIRSNKAILHNKQAIYLFILIFLGFTIFYGAIIYFPSMAQLRFHLSSSEIGVLISVGVFASAVVSFLLGSLSKITSLSNLLILSGLTYLISQISMLFMPSVLWFMLPLIFCGIGQGLCVPIVGRELVAISEKNYSELLALNATIFRISQSVSPFIYGIAWTLFSWEGAYYFGIVLSLLFLGVMFFSVKEENHIKNS